MLQMKPFYGVSLLSLLLAPPPAWGKVTPIDDYQQVLKSSDKDITGNPDSLVCGDYGLLSTEPSDKVCSRRSLPNGKVCFFDCKCKPEYLYSCNSEAHVGEGAGCVDNRGVTLYTECKCADGFVDEKSFIKDTTLVDYPENPAKDGGGVTCYKKSDIHCITPYKEDTPEETDGMITYSKTKPHDWLETDCVMGYDISPNCKETPPGSNLGCIEITEDYKVTLMEDKQLYCAIGCSNTDTCAANTEDCISMTGQEFGATTCYEITGCATNCPVDKPGNPPFTAVEHTSKKTTCYEVTGCAGDYSKTSPTSPFTVDSQTSGAVTCYAADGCTDGYSTSSPGEAFEVDSLTSGSITCYAATGCADGYGKVDSSIFKRTGATSGGHECYKATDCADDYGKVDSSVFKRSGDTSNGHECYVATGCAGDYSTSSPGAAFDVEKKTSGTITCYKATDCATGYSTSSPGSAFDVEKKTSGTITCYKATGCATGYSTSSPGEAFDVEEQTSGSITCYKAIGCATGYGKVDTTVFKRSGDTSNGHECYKATGCATGYGKVDSSVFKRSGDTSNGHECYKATGCASGYGKVDSSVFKRSGDTSNGHECYKATGCATGYSTSKPGSAFKTDSKTSGSFTCYKATGCASGYTSTKPDCYSDSQTAGGITCYKATTCSSGSSGGGGGAGGPGVGMDPILNRPGSSGLWTPPNENTHNVPGGATESSSVLP